MRSTRNSSRARATARNRGTRRVPDSSQRNEPEASQRNEPSRNPTEELNQEELREGSNNYERGERNTDIPRRNEANNARERENERNNGDINDDESRNEDGLRDSRSVPREILVNELRSNPSEGNLTKDSIQIVVQKNYEVEKLKEITRDKLFTFLEEWEILKGRDSAAKISEHITGKALRTVRMVLKKNDEMMHDNSSVEKRLRDILKEINTMWRDNQYPL